MSERVHHKVEDWNSKIGRYVKEYIQKHVEFRAHCKAMSEKYGDGHPVVKTHYELEGVAVNEHFAPRIWQKITKEFGYRIVAPHGRSPEARQMRRDFALVRKPDSWDFSSDLPGFKGVLAIGNSMHATSLLGNDNVGYVISMPVNVDNVSERSNLAGCRLLSTAEYLEFSAKLDKE